jgi:lipopolysaccharide transport system permease protein
MIRQILASPRAILASLWRNRALVLMLAKRDAIGRYRGSALGILWSFVHPVLMLTVYTFVFSGVFRARWSGGTGSTLEYALIMFSGLLTFTLFSECLNRAPSLMLANVNYVKKVQFPLEVLPWIAFGSALFHMVISLSVWLVFYMFVFGLPSPTAVLLPLVLAPLALIIMGLSWFLAALGVYLRDVSQFVGIVTSAMIFLSPIFYPLTVVREDLRRLLYLNPLTPAVEHVRAVLIWGTQPNWAEFGVFLLVGIAFFCVGFAFFQKARNGFADVL